MSTSSERALRAAAAAAAANTGGGVVVNPGADRAERLAVAEAAAAQAIEAARQRPTQPPHYARSWSSSPGSRHGARCAVGSHRHLRSAIGDAEAIVGRQRPSRRCTRTLARGRHGRC